MQIILLFMSLGCFCVGLVLTLVGHKVPYLNLSLPLLQNLSFGLSVLGLLLTIRQQKLKIIGIVLTFAYSVFQLATGGHFWFFYWWIGALTLPSLDVVDHRNQIQKMIQPYWKNWIINQPKVASFLRRHHNILLLAALLTLTFFFFKVSLNLYFQGDEWYHFLKYQESVKSPWWYIYGLVRVFQKSNPLGFHMSPVHEWITLWLFRIFGLNYLPYIATFLILHAFNGFLVFHLVKLISKKMITAMVAALFFTVTVAHQQAITWAAAAPATTLAVMWVLLCLIFLFKFFKSRNSNQLNLAFLFMLLSLLTKETGLLLPPVVVILYVYFQRPRPLQFFTQLWGVWLSMIIFGSIRYFFAPIGVDATGAAFDPKLGLATFRFFSFALKGFSQLFVPSQLIKDLSIWITEMQFPFFNTEKAVQGSTYVNFVQGPAYELISYCLSFIFVIFLLVLKLPKKILGVSVLIFLSGIVPLIGLTYVFPFWGYTPLLDSRHLYHLSIAASFLFAVSFVKLSQLISGYAPKSHHKPIFSVTLFVLLLSWSVWQYRSIQVELSQLRPDAIQRKRIISSVLDSIGTPPKKMIVYVKSDHSYYGFATFMLPFQTAFSHMLPVIFSQTYNGKGLDYPPSFYGSDYLPTGGLVSQGYFEDQEYGLGFFLERIPLIKTLEKNNFSPDIVYAFTYNGETYDMAPINKEFREQIKLLIDPRTIFQSWKRYGQPKHLMSFQAEPSWTVTSTQSSYSVKDNVGQPILDIQVIPNTPNDVFSLYVGQQSYQGKKIGTNYLTSYLVPDLDQPHIIIGSDLDRDFFGVSGHNKNFYHFKVSNVKQAQLLFRTLEFVDAEAEEISLPDAVKDTQ